MKRLLGFGAILFLSISSFAEDKPAGKVLRVKGKVLFLNGKSQIVADNEGKRSRSTKEGSFFYVGETIQTKAGSRIKISFYEGGPRGKNEVVLGPNSTLVIQDAPALGEKKTGTKLSLSNGKIRANIRKKYSGQGDDSFQVRTPNAVAGVRGTVFSVFYNAFTLKSDFATEVGTIFAKTSTGGKSSNTVNVKAGMFTSTGGAGNMAPPAPLHLNPKLKQAVQELGDPGGFSDRRNFGVDAKSEMVAEMKAFEESQGEADDAGGASARQQFEFGVEEDGELSADAPLGREPQQDGRGIATDSPFAGSLMGDSGDAGTFTVIEGGDLGDSRGEEPIFNPKILNDALKKSLEAGLDQNLKTFGDTTVTVTVR